MRGNRDGFRLGERLGQGGGGEVFAAVRHDGRAVAVKRLGTRSADKDRRASRWKDEMRIALALKHPNIAAVYGVDSDANGQDCLVMELVDGVDLNHLPAPLTMDATLHVARGVLAALAYAHKSDIVHRDVSPANVLLSWQGEVKLTDFGIAQAIGARPTTGAWVRGKVAYLSPEQAAADRVLDARSDLFSVGVLMYEMLTGQRPFAGASHEIIAQLLSERYQVRDIRAHRPDVPAAIAQVTMTLLQRDREERFASAEDALHALPVPDDGPGALREQLAGLREDESPSVDARPRPKRRRWPLALVAGAGLAVVWLLLSAEPTVDDTPAATSSATETVLSLSRDAMLGETMVGVRKAQKAVDGPRKPIAQIPADETRAHDVKRTSKRKSRQYSRKAASRLVEPEPLKQPTVLPEPASPPVQPRALGVHHYQPVGTLGVSAATQHEEKSYASDR